MANIRVAAAASLATSLNQLAPAFNDATGHTVEYIYQGSSGYLAAQINARTINPDVFMTAAPYQMNDVQDGSDIAGVGRGLVAGSRFDFLGNKLALIKNSHHALPVSISGFAAVSPTNTQAQNVPIFIAQPDSPNYVPAGNYARDTFLYFGNWTNFVEGYATTANMFDVTQVLEAVANASGPAIGVVYNTDALSNTADVDVIEFAPDSINDRIIYPVGIIADTAQLVAAQSFTTYLQNDGLQFFLDNNFTSRL